MGERGAHPIRVLVVETEPEQRLLTGWVLEQAGMAVVTAATGPDGLETALDSRPDVILLDLMLPGFSGVELLCRYRAEGGRAPAIVVTANTDRRLTDNAVAAGAALVVYKPVHWGDLLGRVRFFHRGLAGVCEDLLSEMEAPRWEGFSQAARCAGLLGEGRCAQLKEAYIETVGADQADLKRVEINIRRLVKELHGRGAPAYGKLLELTGAEGRPTNRAFLFALAQAARIRL